ncbi:MAG: serine protease [Dehalococcoidia bacterium]|jgi:hypothetical protein|nr:serine protease [Dehalococcoidia bacterium]
MPRISDNVLDCSIYLYPTERDAKEGTNIGGSGFLVGITSDLHVHGHVLAVTNSHVIEGGASIIRINKADGQVEILPIPRDIWIFHPNGDDVAVCYLLIHYEPYQIKVVDVNQFITKKEMIDLQVGIGDEIFMVGRLIGLDGKQKNNPVVRLGNIASKSTEYIKQDDRDGYLQESFIIETHSISGFSGSPVFFHILPASVRPDGRVSQVHAGPWLLGIDWGHFSHGGKDTGISFVVPAWKLQELLNSKKVAAIINEIDTKLKKAIKDKQKYFSVEVDSGSSREQLDSIVRKEAQQFKKQPKSDLK